MFQGASALTVEWVDRIGTLAGDAFWDFATSYPVMVIIGLIAVAAFVVGHVPAIVERVFPALVPFTRSALLVQIAAAAVLMFLVGFRVADGRAEIANMKNDIAWKDFQLDQLKQTADEAHVLKEQADARASEAKGLLNEWRTKHGDKPDGAFTPDDLIWLRNVQARRASARRR
jgi:hypothetical protein